MKRDAPMLFALHGSRALGEKVGRELRVSLAEHVEKEFADGECKCRPLADVRGKDVFVLHSLFRDETQNQNEKLMRLLMLAGALVDAAAADVTAVVPYLCYARQDRKTEANDPVTTRYLARMFEAVGADRIVTMDVHNVAAFENAFRLPTEHIEATALFAAHFAALLAGRDAIVVSPDAGGAARAERLRRALSRAQGRTVASGLVEKHRGENGLRGEAAFGEFSGRAAIILDDMISTGDTIVRAAHACRRLGASAVYAAATHAAFTAGAARALSDAALDGIVVTNSIAAAEERIGMAPPRFIVLDAAPLVAASIRDVHAGRAGTRIAPDGTK